MGAFQNRLKQIRGKLTQEQISTKIDIPVVTYGRYERGEVKPDIEFVEKICMTFNVSPTWLILGEGSMCQNEIAEWAAPPADVAAWAAPPADIASWAAPPSPLLDLVREIVVIVEKLMQEHDLVLPPKKKAELIALLVEEFAEEKEKGGEVSKEKILRLIKALAV
ncbi:MAG: helix-turn-helix domain-containing protein [Desulfobaccales bacterium]